MSVSTKSASHAEIDESIVTRQEATGFRAVVRTQPFWVFVALLAMCFAMSFISDRFMTENNLFNITRNFAFMGIMALGMTVVIITAGIDLSVGSVMGLSGMVAGVTMGSGLSIWAGLAACLATALACGLVNGVLIAYLRLSPFVVTLGMMAIARSLALVVSNNRLVYEFGPDEEAFIAIGSSTILGVANPVWVLVVLSIIFVLVFRYSTWARHVFAVGGDEEAAKRTGVETERIIVSVYVVSALTAGIAAFMMVSWLGSVSNSLGQTYELRVIAASVIGGANLMGGQGYALGAMIGAALVEVIRNSLLLAGVDPYWQGFFVGVFIILAVLLERLRRN